MSFFKEPTFQERAALAAKARKELLEPVAEAGRELTRRLIEDAESNNAALQEHRQTNLAADDAVDAALRAAMQ